MSIEEVCLSMEKNHRVFNNGDRLVELRRDDDYIEVSYQRDGRCRLRVDD